MNTIALREYKATLTLSETQREVLIGALLGDGHLEMRGREAGLKVDKARRKRSMCSGNIQCFESG